MRIESVIAVDATQTVGPTRLRLLTARSSRLPVVVVNPTIISGPGDSSYETALYRQALEISEQLGLSPGSVKRHLHEARGRLAQRLDSTNSPESGYATT